MDNSGWPEDTRTQLAAAVDESPTEPRYLVRFARLLLRLNEVAEAASVIARLESLEPTSERVSDVKAALVEKQAAAKKR